MKCKECNTSTSFSYDEVLGEEYCTQCGFIRVTKIFEDRPAVSEIIKSNLPLVEYLCNLFVDISNLKF